MHCAHVAWNNLVIWKKAFTWDCDLQSTKSFSNTKTGKFWNSTTARKKELKQLQVWIESPTNVYLM
jgi:hypothetical protein